jgi:hypothetical protein
MVRVAGVCAAVRVAVKSKRRDGVTPANVFLIMKNSPTIVCRASIAHGLGVEAELDAKKENRCVGDHS